MFIGLSMRSMKNGKRFGCSQFATPQAGRYGHPISYRNQIQHFCYKGQSSCTNWTMLPGRYSRASPRLASVRLSGRSERNCRSSARAMRLCLMTGPPPITLKSDCEQANYPRHWQLMLFVWPASGLSLAPAEPILMCRTPGSRIPLSVFLFWQYN
jgi:hypothetical protein